MKRTLACLLAALSAGIALAQAPFTIVRPADGSKVRETVHVLFPLNSIPKGGYVGIFVSRVDANGQPTQRKFIEALVPPENGKFLDYPLDTMANGIQDGQIIVEAVLYINFTERPRVVDRSSVQVTLSNKANIPIPAKGIVMRYKWYSGRTYLYNVDETVTDSSITESQAKLGGTAAQVPVEHYFTRDAFEVDNVYDNGDALIRLQLQPPPGAHSFLAPLQGETTPRRVFDTNLYPLYMRVHRTGVEDYGLIPSYWGFEGAANTVDSSLDVYRADSLPILPVGPVKPGDTWFTRIQIQSPDDVDQAKVLDKNTLFDRLPARGEFVGVEWQMGYPCAKCRNTFSLGSGGPGLGRDQIKTNAQSVEETYWYAMDSGVVVKFERTEVIDQLVNAPQTNPTGGTVGGTTGGQGQGRFGSGSFAPGQVPGSFGNPAGGGKREESITNPLKQFGGGAGFSPRGQGGGQGGFAPGGAGAGNGQYNTLTQTTQQTQPQDQGELHRVTRTELYTLVH